MQKSIGYLLLILFFFVVCSVTITTTAVNNKEDDFIVPPIPYQKPLYAEWAHHHWVWIDHKRANQQVILDLVNGYISRDIPVGAIDIDSEWSTGINNYIVDTNKFPSMYQLVKTMHANNIKVICWTTSVVDTDSSNFEEGKAKNYFLNNGKTVKWWHGHGAFIDYTNPEALQWWHNQLDNVLILNKTDPKESIDGWKCDGTDPYVLEFIEIYGKKGKISEREYANDYYRDFYYYTKQVRGDDVLIMARPVDSYFSSIYFNFAPRDVVFSGWVGDQESTFDGMKLALKNMFHSAFNNYVGFGSDIGGYKGAKEYSTEVFVRWFQMGAFNSLMENGGNGPHQPWLWDTSTLNITSIYRKFVYIHYELNPYLYSTGIEAYNTGKSMMQPLTSYFFFNPDVWTYLLGKDILVTPKVEFKENVEVKFPSANNWVDYFNHSKVLIGDDKIKTVIVNSLDTFPVYYRAGSILPLNISNNYVNLFGNKDLNDGYLTLAIHYPNKEESTVIHSHGIKIEYKLNENGNMFVTISAPNQRKDLKILLHIRGLNSKSFKVNYWSQERKDYISLKKFNNISDFKKHTDRDTFVGSFMEGSQLENYSLYSSTNNVIKVMQHKQVWIKLHDLSKGVKVNIASQ